MQLIRGRHNIRPHHHGCVATIGNFDGVHLGHSEILKRLRQHSEREKLPGLVIIFEPQPAEFFQRGRVPPRLSRFREKFQLLRERGVDRLMVFRFNAELASYTARQFVEEVLVEQLGIKALIIGDDFRFGRGRDGDFGVLHDLAETHGFVLEQTPPFLFIGKRISSTYVRQLLRYGYMREAERMLGHPYFIEGKVVHGHKQGRVWGFPTANLDLHRLRSPVSGIYAVRVSGLGAELRQGVAYVGNRPIIDDPRYVLEVHMFDFDQDCYGKLIRVQFLDRIRGDMMFNSFEEMAEQIKRDCEVARDRLNFEYQDA